MPHGVPPGLTARAGEARAFTPAQHDDLQLFAEQLITMRRWLAARGYRATPLYLTEYGILLSPQHGFDSERVRHFFLGAMAYLQQARDAATGYPADENRLVQRWAWFSLNFYAFDSDPGVPEGLAGLNGNLFDHGSGDLTALGTTFIDYGARLHQRTVDLAMQRRAGTTPTLIVTNRGDAPANGFRLRLWRDQQLVETVTIAATLLPHCGNQLALPLHWQVAPTGTVAPLRIELLPALGQFAYDK
ncbi:MAG: hypothetical protein R2867_45200 [Caldilineaceae bacterium]